MLSSCPFKIYYTMLLKGVKIPNLEQHECI